MLFIRPGSNAAQIRRLADRYDASVVEIRGPRELLAYCREHHIGMEEDVVSELLGNRRREASAGAPDSARTRCASWPRLLVAGVLTAGGLAITSN